MTKRAERPQRPPADTPHVDTQSLSDTGTYLYETVATLEYAGQRPTRTARGLLTVTTGRDELMYWAARRGWSTQPGQAAGHPMS